MERDDRPEVFSSVIASPCWGVETTATVGYGDIRPVTTAGKLIGAFVMLLGIDLFAPGFTEVMHHEGENDSKVLRCPHCGTIIGDEQKGKETADEDQSVGSQCS